MNGPILLCDKQDIAAPGANTDILATALQQAPGCFVMRITVCLATSSVFNVRVKDGTNWRSVAANLGVALVADVGYTFDFYIARKSTDTTALDRTVNFQVVTDGIIRHLNVVAIDNVAA